MTAKTYRIRRSQKNQKLAGAEAAGLIADLIDIGSKSKRISWHGDCLYGLEPTNTIRVTVGDDFVILWDWHGNPPPEEI